jgi:VCBS repeat-containing protein
MSVSNFEDKNYTEQQGTIQLSTLGTFANGINYGAGYVEFAVSQNGDSGDYLRLTSASNPNANGAVSITGSVVYLGNGTSKIQIGTVDAVNNGQDGHALRINFDNVSIAGTSPVVNGDFSRTNGNSSNIPGWTAVTQHIDLGVTKIAGWATPEAPLIVYPSNTPGGNDNDLVSGYDLPEVKVTTDGRLLLQETNLSSTSFGVVHGPAAYSDVFAASAGMVLKFDWAANYVNDYYHVVGYLLNADTGAISVALQGWGMTGAGIGSVGVPATGNYRFVFVSGTYDASGGTVLGASMYIDNIRVETGAITDAVVQTLARQVVYENTSDNPAATKTVTVSAKNINGTVSTDALNISVTQVNDAPVKTSTVALANGTEDVLYTVSKASLLAGFSDPDGDVMSVTGLSASQGTVTANADGSFSVSQAANFNGNVTLQYTVSDGHGGSLAASKTFLVAPVNDAPVAAPDSGMATVGGATVSIDVLANDTDVDVGDTKALVSVNTSGTKGSVSIANGKVSYDPAAAFQALGAGATATDTFTYTMKDSAGATSTATVTMTVTGVNDAPVAVADSGAASEDGGAVVIDVLANDTDVDTGDTKTLVSVNAAGTVGSVSIVDGKVSYDPGAHFQSLGAGATATDTFSYTMKDSAGVTSTATVTMTINGVNDGPVAGADSGAASEDGKAVVIDVLANDTDVDAGDSKTLVSVNAAGTVGSVSIADGKVSYDPGAHFQSLGAGATATDTFTYTMKDSAGATSTATVTMTITGVNDAPVAVADSGAATEDGKAVVIDVLANDTDVDAGDTKTLVSVNTAGTTGSVSIVDGKVSYDPGAHFQSLGAGVTATDTFTYTMKDSAGIESTATVTMTVTGVNDGPVAVADSGAASEDGGAVSIDVLSNDTDVDAGDSKTLVSVSTAGTTGSVSIVDGKVSYDPGAAFQSLGAGATATDTFTYTMKDSAGATSTATVTMTITGVNDAPVAVADSGAATEDGKAVVIDVLANDTDVDAGDSKTLVSVNTAGTVGSVSIVDGKVSYDPGANFQSLAAGATATDTFTYTMKDSAGATSTATVTMTVTGVNDGPVAVADKASVSEDGVLVVDVLANDTDVDAGDTKTLVSVNTSGTVGSVSIVDGKVSYDPGAHFQSLGAGATATDTFSYTMKDSAGVTSTATVTMTINGVNDGPVAVADSGAATEDGKAVVIDVLANDTDVDAGDTRTLVSVSTAGTTGSVSIVDGKVSYDPGAHFQSLGAGATATDTFSYTMKDSAGATSTATVTMTVTGVNDGPVAVADSGAATEDGKAVVIDVLANDTDVDAGDTKTLVSVNAAGTVGSVSIVDGKVSYDPGANFQSLGAGATATDTFSYTMKDSAGVTSTATVTMIVTGVNDGPVAVADSATVQEKQTVTINVLANDTDIDAGDVKLIASADSVSKLGGTVSIVNGALQYSASADTFDLLGLGQSVTDSFSYTMKDAKGALSSTTVTVKVMGAADGANIVGTVKDDAGAKALVGTALDEHIYGDNGSDELFGNGGSDHLFGENGEDTLDGGNGIDFLDGGNGKDVLIGGRGSDVMTGGEGNDVFVFNKDSIGTDVDVITDFKVGNDMLRLLDSLAIASTAKVDYNHDGVMDTELVLSNGTHIELLGVSNLANTGLLLS